MKVQARQIDSFIKAPPQNILAVLVYGPDDGLVRERAKILGQTAVEDLKDPFRVTELTSGEILDDTARLMDETAAMSMTGGRRLVRVRDSSDKMTPILRDLLENPPQNADCLVVIEGGDLGPRSSLRKLFEKQENAGAVPCYVDDERSLTRVIQDSCRDAGFRISSDAVAYLSSNLIGDRMMARGELEKLLLYMGAYNDDNAQKGEITLDDALACVGNNAAMSMDDIAQATASGRDATMDKTLTTLFAEGISPIGILRAVQGHFRRLHFARSHMENGDAPDVAMKKLRPPVFFKVQNAFRAQLNIWSLDMLSLALERLAETEAECKRTGYPDETLCARTLFALAQMAKRRRRAA